MHNPELFEKLSSILNSHSPALIQHNKGEGVLEYCGTKQARQGKQLVDGYYFASIMDKPGDVRFYFFPIYTHVDQFSDVSAELRKMLKGKSCFHLKPKNVDAAVLKELETMISKGVGIYLRDGFI